VNLTTVTVLEHSKVPWTQILFCHPIKVRCSCSAKLLVSYLDIETDGRTVLVPNGGICLHCTRVAI
jgi:hypothetical protein